MKWIVFVALLVTLCASFPIPYVCPYADAVHALPTVTAGLWRENRLRLVSLAKPSLTASALIFLTGDIEQSRDGFRQNSNFYYVTGANMPGYYVSLHVTSESSVPFTTLFVPAPSADYAIWNGHVYTKTQLQEMYDVDAVLYTNETTIYAGYFPTDTTVYTITSSVALPTALNRFTINRSALGTHMTNSRATKSDKEITLMKLVNQITSFAHVSAMQFIATRMNTSDLSSVSHKAPLNYFAKANRAHLAASSSAPFTHVPLDDEARATLAETPLDLAWKPRQYKPTVTAPVEVLYEYEVQSLFEYQTGLCGALQQAYEPIVGSGNNGAILHYVANNMQITTGELLLIDAGGEYWGYGSDVTRTYPVNGIFTAAQKLIYSIVLQAQADVVAVVKPGATWTTLNTVARASITRYLLDAGLLQGTFTELINAQVYNIFYPHGIGHSVGLDVHDSQTTTLAANQVITVEPGVYFNDYLLDQAAAGTRSQYIVWDVVNTFRGTGGVRIEDDYVVTATGCTPITTVPSSIDAIEKIMQTAQLYK